ncbi:MAG: succinate dehydrogenase [Paracoccaceae bacterium]
MRLTASLIAVPLGLSACAEGGVADQLARAQAKDAVNPVIARNFPGVPLEPSTDCVIDNARASEIVTLARASVAGLTPADGELVLEIATRPETLTCLLDDGLAPFVT